MATSSRQAANPAATRPSSHDTRPGNPGGGRHRPARGTGAPPGATSGLPSRPSAQAQQSDGKNDNINPIQPIRRLTPKSDGVGPRRPFSSTRVHSSTSASSPPPAGQAAASASFPRHSASASFPRHSTGLLQSRTCGCRVVCGFPPAVALRSASVILGERRCGSPNPAATPAAGIGPMLERRSGDITDRYSWLPLAARSAT